MDMQSKIDEQVVLLNSALDAGAYRDGYERDLAAEVVAQLPPAERPTALHQLAYERVMGLVTVDCLLDECAAETYVLIGQMTDLLVAAIQADPDSSDRLLWLVIGRITDDASLSRRIGQSSR